MHYVETILNVPYTSCYAGQVSPRVRFRFAWYIVTFCVIRTAIMFDVNGQI